MATRRKINMQAREQSYPGLEPDIPDVCTVLEIAEILLRQPPRKRWGPWRIDKKNQCIYHYALEYWISLSHLRTSAQVLDFIMQVSHKRWMSSSDTGWFIEAIRDLVNPQATMCSFGVERSHGQQKENTVTQ